MPIFFGIAALAAFLLWREKNASAATNPNPMLSAATSMAQLAPGAAQYLPPINAPDWVRVTYANAMASGNPIQMVAAANQIMAASPELAHALSVQYQGITNNPIPGVAGVGAFAPFGAFGGAFAHPHMVAPQHLPAPAYGHPGMAPARPMLDAHTIRTLASMNRARKVRRTADLHRALTAAAARRHLQNT